MRSGSGGARSISLLVLGVVGFGCMEQAVEPLSDLMTLLQPMDNVCADGPTLNGIDVSHWQGEIDWDAVASDDRDIRFAFIRVSDGLFEDRQFDVNWFDARRVGILRGVYQYFRAGEDPVAQADLLLSRMGELLPGDLPPVADVENMDGESSATLLAQLRTWIERVSSVTGREPIIYTGPYFWRDQARGGAEFSQYPLWIAHYTNGCPLTPPPWDRWAFWQNSSSGRILGIAGDVDTDYFAGDEVALEALASVVATCGDGRCNGGETQADCPGDCPSCEPVPAEGRIIDQTDLCFEQGGAERWWRHADAGYGGSLIWTHTTANASVDNFGIWHLTFLRGGRYRVEAYTDGSFAESAQAGYQVQHGGRLEVVRVDQGAVDGWNLVGDFEFAAGDQQWVRLDDNTGEPNADHVQIVYDALRLTLVEPLEGEGEGAEPEGEGVEGEGEGGAESEGQVESEGHESEGLDLEGESAGEGEGFAVEQEGAAGEGEPEGLADPEGAVPEGEGMTAEGEVEEGAALEEGEGQPGSGHRPGQKIAGTGLGCAVSDAPSGASSGWLTVLLLLGGLVLFRSRRSARVNPHGAMALLLVLASGCSDPASAPNINPPPAHLPRGAVCPVVSAACGPGLECHAGRCQVRARAGQACGEEVLAFCDDDLQCMAGWCVAAAGLGQPCNSEAASPCRDGLICQDGLCFRLAGDGELCDPGQSVLCEAGLTCEQGRCAGGSAGPGEACGPAADGLACAVGYECLDLQCRLLLGPGGDCRDPATTRCMPELVCLEGACLKLLAEGEDCAAATTACAPPLVCVSGRCRAGLPLDAPCPGPDDLPCSPDLVCLNGHCRALIQAGPGEECLPSLGLGCAPGLECLEGLCRLVRGAGESCVDQHTEACVAGLTCLDDLCRRIAGLGEACGDDTTRCTQGLACLEGRCRELLAPGADCSDRATGRCVEGSYCLEGQCIWLLAAGEECRMDDETRRCGVGLGCFEGLCRDVIDPGADCSDARTTVCRSPYSCLDGRCRITIGSGADCRDLTSVRCRAPLQCVDARCQLLQGTGERCDEAQGLDCPLGLTCVDQRCKAFAGPGDDCSQPTTTECVEPLDCVESLCQGQPCLVCREVIEAGGACAAGDATTCRPPTRCVAGVCRTVVQAGGDCSDAQLTACAEGLRCLDGRCRTLLGLGGDCANPLVTRCGEPLVCVDARCLRVVGLGADCSDPSVARCGDGLTCQAGRCRELLPPGGDCSGADGELAHCIAGYQCLDGRCRRLALAGESCLDPAVTQCQEGLDCVAGLCRLTVAAGEACQDSRRTRCAAELVCVDGLCRTLLGPGEDCSRPALTACAPPLACLDGLCLEPRELGEECGDPLRERCRNGLTCQEGLCSALRSAGQECGEDLGPGIVCQEPLICSGGTCRAEQPAGGSCADPRKAFCDEGLLCVEGFCRVLRGPGEDCRDPWSTFCSLGLQCIEGRCQALIGPGGDCSNPATSRCQAGLTCHQGRCLTLLGLGQACPVANSTCVDGTWCLDGICMILADEGEVCSNPATTRCRNPLQCKAGFCRRPAVAGEACGDPAVSFCAAGLECVNSRCKTRLAAGGNCSDPRTTFCTDGLTCLEGQCKAILDAGGRCADRNTTACRAGLECIDATCRAVLAAGGDCSNPALTVCGADLTCTGGRCRTILAAGGICEDKQATQCQNGLVCGHDNGARHGLAAYLDVCTVSGCGDGIVGGNEACDDGNADDGDGCRNNCTIRVVCPPAGKVNGQVGYCTTDCRCAIGSGSCAENAQCQAGLVCGLSNGARFGLAANVNVCVLQGCGDGRLQAGEACDDGNLNDADGCRNDCSRPPTCPPPGTVNGQPGHCTADCPCDAGGADCTTISDCRAGLVCGRDNGGRYSLAINHDVCTASGCGDGWPGAGEECDDGNLTDNDACRNNCTLPEVAPVCPPAGTVNGDETRCSAACPCAAGQGDCDSDQECQAGLVCGLNNGSRFQLLSTVDVCMAAGCGDGRVGAGEACDDGDLDDTDACRNNCTLPVVCPPAGLTPGHTDYCTSLCPCRVGGGDCDLHSDCQAGLICGNDNGARHGLPPSVDVCTTPGCGDGLVGAGETCDDGNLDDTDGCRNNCQLRPPCPPPGTVNGQVGFCTADCPCAAGQGPCTGATTCQAGLVCGQNNGLRYGLPATLEVCAPSGCGDGLLGANEPCDDGNLTDNDGCTNNCGLPCRDVAVLVGSDGTRLVIDRHEASRPDATAASAGQDGSRACSKSGVLPWSNASLDQAAAACRASGGHLCLQSEWQWACSGESLSRPYPYGEYWQAGYCNGYRGANNQLALTGAFTNCVTPEGVFDLVGNLFEWVATGSPDPYVFGGSYKLTALAVSQRLDSCNAQITVVPAADVGFRCCGGGQ